LWALLRAERIMHQPGALLDGGEVARGPLPVGRQHQLPLVARSRLPPGVDQQDQGEQDQQDRDEQPGRDPVRS
jgi:hypothetical protein